MFSLTGFLFAAFASLLFVLPFGRADADVKTVQSYQQFERQIREEIAPLAGKEVVALKSLYLSHDVGPWLDTGLSLQTGDRVSMVLNGKVWLSRVGNLSFNAPFAVWCRIGDSGPIFKGARNTLTFTAGNAGKLQLKLYPAERWLDKTGRYLGEPPLVNADGGGGVNVALVQWAAGADIPVQLEHLAETSANASWAGAEIERMANMKLPPAGWNYIWELDPAEMFTDALMMPAQNAPARAVALDMDDDAGILEKPALFELTPETTLSWKWKVDRLPSAVSEDSLATHDYMSIAVKFDNGRDLTFFWSRALPVNTAFHCPLPGWSHRETHVVARTGSGDMGKWLGEEKNILDYYRKAIGGPLPKRITHVWLIGVSLFQHGKGQSQFGDIVLHDGARHLQVY